MYAVTVAPWMTAVSGLKTRSSKFVMLALGSRSANQNSLPAAPSCISSIIR